MISFQSVRVCKSSLFLKSKSRWIKWTLLWKYLINRSTHQSRIRMNFTQRTSVVSTTWICWHSRNQQISYSQLHRLRNPFFPRSCSRQSNKCIYDPKTYLYQNLSKIRRCKKYESRIGRYSRESSSERPPYLHLKKERTKTGRRQWARSWNWSRRIKNSQPRSDNSKWYSRLYPRVKALRNQNSNHRFSSLLPSSQTSHPRCQICPRFCLIYAVLR